MIKIDPNHKNSFTLLTKCNQEANDPELAIMSFEKVLEVRPNDAVMNVNLGMALMKQGQLDEALKACERAISIKPELFEAYDNMGLILKDQGKLHKAIMAHQQALSINSDYYRAYYNLGNAYKEQGQLDEAIEAYQRALSINPNYIEAHNNLGNAYKDRGELSESIKCYKKVLSLNPYSAETHNNLGNVLKDQGNLEEAISTYKEALIINPNYADAYNNLGISFKDTGNLKEAISSYKKSISLNPFFAEAYNNLGNAYKEENKLDEAIFAYNKALEIKPDNPEINHLLSSLNGITTNSAPREYVEKLFDEYANKFDQSLVENLEYRIPKIIKKKIVEEQKIISLGSVLDLGCGTGLVGLEIKNFCSKLNGVDVSKAMLSKAKMRNVYDELNHADIIDYLSSVELDYDYIFSADVFAYFGELSEIFKLIKSRNKRNGKLVFSTEHNKNNNFYLEKTGRYSHSRSYIDKLCKQFHYSVSHFSETNLRKEKGIFLTGGLYILEF